MKIVLLRRNNNSQTSQDAESYMRIVFAHISHKVWIQSVESSPVQGIGFFGSQEQIIVTCKAQGENQEDDKLARSVIEAVGLRGDLELVKVLVSAPTKEFDAIKQLDDQTYGASTYFSEYLARNGEYREELKTAAVKKVTYQVEQVAPGAFRPTGRIGTQIQGEQDGMDPTNIYNCYAVALSASEALRDTMLNSNVSRILLTLNEQHCLDVDVTVEREFRFDFSSMAQRQQSPKDLEESLGQLSLGSDDSKPSPRPFS